MDYRLFYTTQAQKDFDKIDKGVAVRILKKLDYFIKLKDPFVQAKKLTGFQVPTFRFRVGDYRIVFRKDQKNDCLVILVVLKIAHRREVYQRFS